MNLELIVILGVLLVVAATTLAPKLGVATPLVLVVLGFGMSLIPFIDAVVIDPEWILAGVLPPLLYSAAVSTPVMEFRRDFGLISVFSVALVVVTAVAIGFLATWLVPGLPLGLGIALGAVVSPTDAVATSIVRRAGVSNRLVTVLEGEAMLNDATALVLLRSAVAAVGVSISLWEVVGQFVWAVAAALTIGWLAGKLNLMLRRWITDVSAGVALSLGVPFLAYLPAAYVGASGLVAAVTAGLVSGYGAAKRLGAEERLAERAVWRTVELLLESAVFLMVGLELPTLISNLSDSGANLRRPLVMAIIVATVVILIRVVFVATAVWSLAHRNRHSARIRDQLSEWQAQLADGQPAPALLSERAARGWGRLRPATRLTSAEDRQSGWQLLVGRRIADLDYLAAEQFGWRDGVILVWAGMRGALTIAAAQTLPADTEHRSLIILTATIVAVGTLAVQGLTLAPLAARLRLTGDEGSTAPTRWRELQKELDAAALESLPEPSGADAARLLSKVRERLHQTTRNGAAEAKIRQLRLTAINAQRAKLIELRRMGTYSSVILDDALAQLDAQQLSIELRQEYD
ncbi:MAG TPA: cation:proton antiporter [Propionibacteriaceae bacterium]|nr:cation:proton antiporter [Propionibacteriaceae bacterium]